MQIAIPPPKNWQDFEYLCWLLWRDIWNDPKTQKNGRQGQPQYGVDIFGQPERQFAWHGIQCKGKHALYGAQLTKDEIDIETEKAKSFSPRLGHFIIATTSPRDIDSSKTYYVQFAAQRGDPKVYAEVVGNEYIEPPYQLSVEQTARIEAAGWTLERVGTVGGIGNYGREWILDASHSTPERVAEKIIALFQNVYGIPPNQVIAIEVTLQQ
jgi:hypothetical protein